MESKDNNPQLLEVSIPLNGFEIMLSRNRDVLTIEAEEIGHESRLFVTHINNDEVKGLTNSLFSDSLSLQQGLIDGLAASDSSIQVKFSDERKICYTWETQHGSRRMSFEFMIPLTEVKLDALKSVERKVEKLQKKVEEQAGEISQLKSEKEKLHSSSEKVILDKIEAFEKRVVPGLLEENNQFGKKLETNLQEKIEKLERLMKDMQSNIERRYNLYEIENRLDKKLKEVKEIKQIGHCSPSLALKFDTAAKNAVNFAFSNNNMTVASMGAHKTWKLMYADKPLPKTSTSFSVKIDLSSNNFILIGIVPKSLLNSDSCFNSAGVSMYYASDGSVYTSGNIESNKLPKSTANSVITVTTDLSANKIQWTVGNNQTWSATLESSFTSVNEYYPCVEFYSRNDKVSFI